MHTFGAKEDDYSVVQSWILEGCVFFFGMSCWDVVNGVCWERVFLGEVDTGKVCILRMVWRVRVKLSGVGWLS